MLRQIVVAGNVARKNAPTGVRCFSAQEGVDVKEFASRWSVDGKNSSPVWYDRDSARGVDSDEKRGKAGRHGHAGRTVTVFGATGFVGRYVVNALGRVGATIIIPTRGDDMSWRHLKPLADYGKIIPAYFSLDDDDSIRDAMKHSDTVINLIGKHYETKHIFPWIINSSFKHMNVDGAKKIARIARQEYVDHLVHVSSLNASLESASELARTKARGEEVVREEFPGAVVLRPSSIYGAEDQLLNWFARVAKLINRVPVVNHGAATVRPTYVGDVADAIVKSALNKSTVNKTYELYGEQEYTRKQILEFVMTTIRKEPKVIDLPESVGMQLAYALEQLPNPLLTRDWLKLMLEDETPTAGSLGFKDLEITPADFEKKAFNFLYMYRQGGHYMDTN